MKMKNPKTRRLWHVSAAPLRSEMPIIKWIGTHCYQADSLRSTKDLWNPTDKIKDLIEFSKIQFNEDLQHNNA